MIWQEKTWKPLGRPNLVTGRDLFTLSFPRSGNSGEIHPSFQKASQTFRKLPESFDEVPMNFVYAKAQCFRMYEIHRKFIEVSG